MKVWKKFVRHFLPSADNAYRPHLLEKPWLIFFLTIVLTSEAIFIGGLLAQQGSQTLVGAVAPAEVSAK